MFPLRFFKIIGELFAPLKWLAFLLGCLGSLVLSPLQLGSGFRFGRLETGDFLF